MERVLVLGIDTPIGLTIVRELGRHGLEVHGVGRSNLAVGLYSRYLSRSYILDGPRMEQFPRLLKILRDASIPTLMTVSEVDVLLLNRHRDQLDGIRLLIPEAKQIQDVLNKANVYEVAAQMGIPVPRTIVPASPDAVGSVELCFPVVMKWSDPNKISPILARAGLPLIKFEYAYDKIDLRVKLARYEPIGQYPLVQEFCPGHGLGQMFLMHHGEVALYFQHRRIHEWPPEGGSSTICEPVPLKEHASLRAKSVALLRKLRWDGVAMVEYRHDPDSGRLALMEINGRFWGSQPLASHAGAEFAWELYRLKVQGGTPGVKTYRTGFRCVFMIPELKRLTVVLFFRERIQNKALKYSRLSEVLALSLILLNPKTRYYVFRLTDPKPFFADILLALRDLVLRRR